MTLQIANFFKGVFNGLKLSLLLKYEKCLKCVDDPITFLYLIKLNSEARLDSMQSVVNKHT